MITINNYDILQVIYSNNYGQIKKVRNIENDSISLMKMMNRKYLKFSSESDTLNEMKQLTSIKNINLSEYKTFFFDDNYFYLIMEYDDDSELNKKIEYNIKNHLSFEENYIWSLTIQILNLVKFIKENKNIDFNLSSINILLMNNGSLKIYDFAKNYTTLYNNDGIWLDDIYIFPPEILNDNKNFDIDAANIWKAGCIIYELCTLHPPFEEKNFKVRASKILEGKYINVDSKYSNDFNILLSKMIIVEQEKRATVDELLNSEIIKKRNVEIEDININENIFTFKKNSLKESKRKTESINEMMQNDKYEIMKFTLSQKNKLSEEQNLNELIDTGHFNMNDNNINFNNNNMNNKINDFRDLIIKAQMKKDNNMRIIEANNYNYNNPYRNNDIDANKKNNENNNNNQHKLNKNNSKINNKNRNNINNKISNNINIKNNINKKIQIDGNPNKSKNKNKNKNLLNDNNEIIIKERQKTPNYKNNNNLYGDILENKNNVNNFLRKDNIPKNKENQIKKKLFLDCPQNNQNNNINLIKCNSKEIKANKNRKSNNNIKEKTDKILNILNSNKKELNKFKLKNTKERKQSNNNNNNNNNNINTNKKKQFPVISNLQSNNVDRIIDKILNNRPVYKISQAQGKNINNINSKDNFRFNFGNENGNEKEKKIMNNNFMQQKMQMIKPVHNLPNITYGKDKKINIEYGVIKFNSHKKYGLKKK